MTEILAVGRKALRRPPKKQILRIVLQNCQILAVKHFIEKSMSLNFVDLPTIFCPRL